MKKLALIGCGGIGRYHLQHFLQFKDIRLAGFCDLIPERAASFAAEAGGAAFTDFREMYDTVQPDMVFIGIPPTAHGEIELETIRRSIPFFVEKPVALDLSLAKQIRDAASKAGLITAVGFQCRYSNLADVTRDYVQQHEIALIQCARIGGVPEVAWWRDKSLSGGQIVEQTIHQFDLIRAVYGEPVSVSTMGMRGLVTEVPDYDTDDLSVSVIRFAGGALGSIATGCYALDSASFDSKITFGSRKSRLDHYLLQKVDQYGELPAGDASTSSEGLIFKGDGTMVQSGREQGLSVKESGDAGLRCDRTFIDAVLSGDGSKIRSPYADAVKSLAFTLACNQSMASGQTIDIQALLAE